MLQEHTRLMTIDQFVRLYATEGPFELVNGERIPLMPNVAGSGLIIRALFPLLYNHCITRQLGEVFSEMTFVLADKPDWVKGSRAPDVMFFAADRWTKYVQETPDWKEKPILLVPDLAIEVVSPNDRYSDIQDKVEEYLQVGVRLVWVMDPQRRRVRVYHGNRLATLDHTGVLSGEDVLPGLEIKLVELF